MILLLFEYRRTATCIKHLPIQPLGNGSARSTGRMRILKNFDVFHRVLRFEEAQGKFEEVERTSEIKQTDFSRGYYVNYHRDVIGVFASAEGPKFFINGHIILLKDRQFRVEVTSLLNRNQATFYQGEEKLFDLSYPKVVYIETDPYATEEMLDFYLWLRNSLEDENFYRQYSINS